MKRKSMLNQGIIEGQSLGENPLRRQLRWITVLSLTQICGRILIIL